MVEEPNPRELALVEESTMEELATPQPPVVETPVAEVGTSVEACSASIEH